MEDNVTPVLDDDCKMIMARSGEIERAIILSAYRKLYCVNRVLDLPDKLSSITTTLWRPVGLRELELISQNGWTSFPAALAGPTNLLSGSQL